MKVMKLALLGTAALAAASLSARADDLSDLKAQIEALNNRIATLEAAPSVPAGYQLLSMSKAPAIVVPGFERDADLLPMANTISILPTADVPASASIQWSGFARAALVHTNVDTDWDAIFTDTGAAPPADVSTSALSASDDDTDILARGKLNLSATTDTAVGAVSVALEFESNWDGTAGGGVAMTKAWGSWAMTPEISLGGGYQGSLASIGHGADTLCDYYCSTGGTAVGGSGDMAQFRLSYASGPLTAAIALEDISGGAFDDDDLGAAAEVTFAGDTFSAEVAGYVNEAGWQAGVGATAKMDMFDISGAFGIGNNDGPKQAGTFLNSTGGIAPLTWVADTDNQFVDEDFWKASVVVGANLTESVRAEIGYGYRSSEATSNTFLLDFDGDEAYDSETHALAGGIYYTPVSQLTLGLEASWVNVDESFTEIDDGDAFGGQSNRETETVTLDFVSVFRF
jgi:hypothetical protein